MSSPVVLHGPFPCLGCECDEALVSSPPYPASIRGIGPMKALKFIREHHTIEAIVAGLDKDKYGHSCGDDLESLPCIDSSLSALR